MSRAPFCLFLAFAFLGLASGPASALPGDPPVMPLSPAPGATLPTDADGIPVSYACPIYRTQDFGEGVVRYGDERDYVVMMSDSPQLDGEGRLADPVARVTGASTPADPNTCTVALGNPQLSPAPQATPGTWYWQVSRLCAMCSPPFEVGPVQSFTLRTSEKPVLRLPPKVFAGYRFIARVDGLTAPAGTEVVLERRQGKRWLRAGSGGAAGSAADLTAILPPGPATVRARLQIGGQVLTSAGKSVRVRPADAKANRVSGGSWTGPGVTGFRVVGRKVVDLRVPVTLLCPTPGMVGQFTSQAATAIVASAKLAPDGSFVAISLRGGQSVRIRAKLSGGSLSGGLAEMSLGACTGSARFSAKPA